MIENITNDLRVSMVVNVNRSLEYIVEKVNELYQGRKPSAVSEETVMIKLSDLPYKHLKQTADMKDGINKQIHTDNELFLFAIAITIGHKIANETDIIKNFPKVWCYYIPNKYNLYDIGTISIVKNSDDRIVIPIRLNEDFSLKVDASVRLDNDPIRENLNIMYKQGMQECIRSVVRKVNEIYYRDIPEDIDFNNLLGKLDIEYDEEMKNIIKLDGKNSIDEDEDIKFLEDLAIMLAERLTKLYDVQDQIVLTDTWFSISLSNDKSYREGNIAKIFIIDEVYGIWTVRISTGMREDGKYKCEIVDVVEKPREVKDNSLDANKSYRLNKDEVIKEGISKYYLTDYVNVLYDIRKGYVGLAIEVLKALQAIIKNHKENNGNSIVNALILLHGHLESIYSTYSSFGTNMRCINRANILNIDYINSLCGTEFDMVYDTEGFKLKLTDYLTLHVKEEKILTQLNEDLLVNKYKIVLEVDIEDLYDYEKDTIDLLKKVSQEGMVSLKFEPEDGLIPSSFVHKLKLNKGRKSRAVNSELPNVMYYAIPKDLSRLDTYPPIYLYDDIEEAIEFKRNAESVIKNTETLEDMQELVLLTAYVVKKK